MSALDAAAFAPPVTSCKPAQYVHPRRFYVAEALKHGWDAEESRAVRFCDLTNCDEEGLVDLVSCAVEPLMCDPCLWFLLLVVEDLPAVFEDMDFGAEHGVAGTVEARARLEAALRAFGSVLDGLEAVDVDAAAEAVVNALPWLAEQQGIGLHELARQVSDAAAQARHLVFRSHDERGYLPDPAYPAASEW